MEKYLWAGPFGLFFVSEYRSGAGAIKGMIALVPRGTSLTRVQSDLSVVRSCSTWNALWQRQVSLNRRADVRLTADRLDELEGWGCLLKAITGAKRYAEGTGVRLLVKSAEDLAAIRALVEIKLQN